MLGKEARTARTVFVLESEIKGSLCKVVTIAKYHSKYVVSLADDCSGNDLRIVVEATLDCLVSIVTFT